MHGVPPWAYTSHTDSCPGGGGEGDGPGGVGLGAVPHDALKTCRRYLPPHVSFIGHLAWHGTVRVGLLGGVSPQPVATIALRPVLYPFECFVSKSMRRTVESTVLETLGILNLLLQHTLVFVDMLSRIRKTTNPRRHFALKWLPTWCHGSARRHK